MIQSSKAVELAQTFNRDVWLHHAEAKLSSIIESAARKGLREVQLCPATLFQGAENLKEIAEMYQRLHVVVLKNGYKAKVTPDANIYICW